jgi:hypothetical protein
MRTQIVNATCDTRSLAFPGLDVIEHLALLAIIMTGPTCVR